MSETLRPPGVSTTEVWSETIAVSLQTAPATKAQRSPGVEWDENTMVLRDRDLV